MPKIRTFLAVEISSESRRQAAALQQTLMATAPTAKWVPAANFHLTLAFLGDVGDRQLADVFSTLATVARTESPFRLTLEGVGAFPTVRRPNTVWAGVGVGQDAMQRLHESLDEPLTDLGLFRREDRGYTPHLTLGRVSDPAEAQALAGVLPNFKDWTGGEVYVQELVANSSETRKLGPEYTIMGRAPLGRRK
jgi:2'-5' RNA ligase